MIVFGDNERVEYTAELMRTLVAASQELVHMSGIERRAAAAGLLIAAGECVQGILDARFHQNGRDAWGPVEIECARLTVAAARLWWSSIPDHGEHGGLSVADMERFKVSVAWLARAGLPDALRIRIPEGYAFYALYPELYAMAARAFDASADPMVIGIRSIGTSLAAVVAVATGTRRLPATVRPAGHPFRRTVNPAPELARMLLGNHGPVAIVDEGPGLSGSSFGAVADWLEEHSVSRARLHFFPGHDNEPGPRATPRHRTRWRTCPRHVMDLDHFLSSTRLFAPWRGQPGAGHFEDISAGAWRRKFYPDGKGMDWPPSHIWQERRKVLFRVDDQVWLARFAGLGRYGDAAWQRGRRLTRAGLVPPLRHLQYGFVVGEWLSRARPLTPAECDRGALLDTMARYLALLVREFPHPASGGADAARLLDMARHNIGESLGPDMAAALEPWQERISALQSRMHVVATDNRMQAWEWLLLPDGTILKADALDHHAGHDCIGAQDIAWDIAGAAVELGLTRDEVDTLETALAARSRHRPDPLKLGFYLPCYLAFQIGYHALASSTFQSMDPAEAARHDQARARHRRTLERLLATGWIA